MRQFNSYIAALGNMLPACWNTLKVGINLIKLRYSSIAA